MRWKSELFSHHQGLMSGDNKDSVRWCRATDLYVSDMTELGLDRQTREQLKVRRVDPKRTFVESVRSFPDNIETQVTVTYDAGQVPLDNALSTISLLMHHSMVRLPEKPMMPRLYDERVSFFAGRVYDYGYDATGLMRTSPLASQPNT
jgi:hypothetical protein